MNQTTIEFSIPDEIYEQAKEICESNGLTLPGNLDRTS